MSQKFTGADKIEIDVTGTDWAAPAVTIESEDIHGETAVEVEENEDTTDPKGNSPHSGQFANITVQSSDFAARSTLVGYRIGEPEQLIDVRFYLPDGLGGHNTITAVEVRAKTILQPVPAEHGQVNGWSLQSRAFVPGVIDFD